jgi:three-Cys-motif partner protein
MGNDRKHFEDYREQTRVKHEILSAYLPVYFTILSTRHKNLVFIDGFAGPGTYKEPETGTSHNGSPIRALEVIAGKKELAERVQTIFIENDKELFSQLKDKVEDFHEKHPEIKKPLCRPGTFSSRVQEILNSLKRELAPTFLFVDPCGIEGASMNTIRAVMAFQRCEVFIFFNLDGVRRVAGLGGSGPSPALVDLMGSSERAQALCDARRMRTSVVDGDELTVSHYRRVLVEDVGAKYVVPFRVEHEDDRKASHYLIHATKHPLGFRIMKDVMWKRGHGVDQAGALELRQSSRTNLIPLFSFKGDEAKGRILKHLQIGPARVSTFYEEWNEDPDDLECESSYRTMLIELEADGKIEVLDKDGQSPKSAQARRKNKGKPTLAKDYFVRTAQTPLK